jgi:hypothetical protein
MDAPRKRQGPIGWLWSKPPWVRWTILVLAVIGSPLSYVLSIGPVAWLWVHVLPDSAIPAIQAFYEPLTPLWYWTSADGITAYRRLWVSDGDLAKRARRMQSTTPAAPAAANPATANPDGEP